MSVTESLAHIAIKSKLTQQLKQLSEDGKIDTVSSNDQSPSHTSLKLDVIVSLCQIMQALKPVQEHIIDVRFHLDKCELEVEWTVTELQTPIVLLERSVISSKLMDENKQVRTKVTEQQLQDHLRYATYEAIELSACTITDQDFMTKINDHCMELYQDKTPSTIVMVYKKSTSQMSNDILHSVLIHRIGGFTVHTLSKLCELVQANWFRVMDLKVDFSEKCLELVYSPCNVGNLFKWEQMKCELKSANSNLKTAKKPSFMHRMWKFAERFKPY